jgi:hypothetical protein
MRRRLTRRLRIERAARGADGLGGFGEREPALAATIGQHVGQRDLAVTANTYTHTLVSETELDYAGLLT